MRACYSDIELTHQNTREKVWQLVLGLLKRKVKDEPDVAAAVCKNQS